MNDLKTILIADDEKGIRDLIIAILGSENYRYLIVENGDSAVEVAISDKPDLIFLDIVMPGKYGWEVCDILKSDPATSHIPVVMLSGLIKPTHVRKAMQLGADAYIPKPFTMKLVMETVNNLLKAPKAAQQEAKAS